MTTCPTVISITRGSSYLVQALDVEDTAKRTDGVDPDVTTGAANFDVVDLTGVVLISTVPMLQVGLTNNWRGTLTAADTTSLTVDQVRIEITFMSGSMVTKESILATVK